MAFFSLVFTLFILIDAPGNIPLYLAVLEGIKPSRQRKIIFREMIFAWIAILIFTLIGNQFLSFLHIHSYSVEIAGGVILFLLALKMIFPKTEIHKTSHPMFSSEPYLVPLAIPLVAGPGLLTSLMLYAEQLNSFYVLGAASLAWLLSLPILILAPTISKKIGKKGIIALERLMGLILVFIAIDLFLNGFQLFFKTYAK